MRTSIAFKAGAQGENADHLQSPSIRSLSKVSRPLSQLTYRSPRVRKQATECLARWCIQPSRCNCVMIASIQGYPVLASSQAL